MSAPKSMAEGSYFDRLDAIRGTAIVWVVLFHFCGAVWGWQTESWEQLPAGVPHWLSIPVAAAGRMLAMGGMGVPMFFVLSGFLIHYTSSRSADSRVTTFWFRRWGRIFPPYLVALVAFALWQGVFWSRRGRIDFLSHLFLVHSFQDRTLFGINASFWSLAHEAHFYLLYPLLARIRARVGMGAVLLGSLAARLAIGVWAQLEPDHFAGDPAIAMMLPRMYFEWILGMYVADCYLQGRRALPWGWKTAGLCLAYAALAYRSPWWDLGVVPAVAIGTGIWIDNIIHHGRATSRVERVLIPLGVVSYSIYLWHQPIVNHISMRIMRSGEAVFFGSTTAAIVALVLCLLASAIVGAGAYHLFEVPAIAWVKRRCKAGAASINNTADSSSMAPALPEKVRVDAPATVPISQGTKRQAGRDARSRAVDRRAA